MRLTIIGAYSPTNNRVVGAKLVGGQVWIIPTFV